jgi:hypothetical protein
MDERPLAELVLEADSSLPDFFLGRLVSLLILQVAAVSPTDRRALGQAVFPTFLDCMDLGLTDRAYEILGFARDTVDLEDSLAACTGTGSSIACWLPGTSPWQLLRAAVSTQ